MPLITKLGAAANPEDEKVLLDVGPNTKNTPESLLLELTALTEDELRERLNLETSGGIELFTFVMGARWAIQNGVYFPDTSEEVDTPKETPEKPETACSNPDNIKCPTCGSLRVETVSSVRHACCLKCGCQFSYISLNP